MKITLIMLSALVAMSWPASAGPGFPTGWYGGSNDKLPRLYEFGTAPANGTVGKEAAYVRAKGAPDDDFFTVSQCIKADNYIGKRMRFSGRLRSVNASAVQLWMRVDGSSGKVMSFYNMANRPIQGTTDWKRYDVVLDVPNESAGLCFGFLLAGGKGEAWADDMHLDAVDKTVPLSQGAIPKAPVNLSFGQ